MFKIDQKQTIENLYYNETMKKPLNLNTAHGHPNQSRHHTSSTAKC